MEEVIGRLEESLVLDDERFARAFAEDKRSLGSWGSERIRDRLVERGVAPDLAAEVAEDPEVSETERATQVLAGRSFDLEDERDRQRALGMLARKGFSSDDSYEAIRIARGRGGRQ